jgi:hypothetical protein
LGRISIDPALIFPNRGISKNGQRLGLNFSQVEALGSNDKIYWQINYGDGIASLLGGLPDATPVDANSITLPG